MFVIIFNNQATMMKKQTHHRKQNMHTFQALPRFI